MKNKKVMSAVRHGFMPVIIILLVLLGISGYVAYKVIQADRAITIGSKVPNVTIDPNVNWKTYTDSINGYSIQFPSDWSTEKVCLGGILNDTYTCIKSPDLELNPVPSVVKGQVVTVGPKGSSYFPGGDLSLSDFCNEDAMSKIKSCTEINIGGIKAIKKIFSNYALVDVAILKDNQIKFIIRLQYDSELLKSTQRFETFDQMLSTFKLIE